MRAACLVPERRLAASGREADRSAPSVRPQAEAWSADRCAAGLLPEGCLREACARNARAALCRPVAPLSEPQSAEPAVWDARVPQAGEAEAAVAGGSAQLPAVAPAASEQLRVAAEEHAEVEAAAQHVGVAAAAVRPASEEQGAAELGVSRLAEVRRAVRERQAAARPLAAASSPSRLRSAPARRLGVRSGHAPLRLRIASP